MKKIRVEDAVGQTLCHDMTAILDNGFKGVKFRRGHIIEESDIPELLKIGKAHIYVWEPDADEVHEDDASSALCAHICDASISLSRPSEGKITLTAARSGLFCVDAEALRRINSLPDYTVACRSNYTAVSAGDKLGGARIVPLVTPRSNVDAAVALADAAYPVMTVREFMPLHCGLIVTGGEIYHGRIQDRMEPIMRGKIAALGGSLDCVRICDDDTDMILAAIREMLGLGAQLILLTGGMSVDPDDVTPLAMRLSGAEIITQGVPMQPGNMLTLARLGDTALVGVPGASMHSPVTSLDIFLPRIFAGVEIRPEDIASFGLGGFCLGCGVCRFPNCSFGKS